MTNLDCTLPEYGEVREMMGNRRFAFKSASVNHSCQRVEYWAGVDNNGAVLRRLVDYRMISMMHSADPAQVLAQFHFETLGRA